ncbi:hypothetical protein EHE19_010760 [Ruminiclostridium herbifermentans]|uniref:DUF8091 domain-containing protein n=2 Tax=Ruminiclostridium herbifermentans TaxID=2488810 RepID=A0A4V6YE71_9FIRM|nr:hypothetical protein EHE19_010760 [Ruminiclostridium herbifermentans]
MIINSNREKCGIGTLGEKTLHAVLKHYFEPYTANHEVRMGSFVADIVGENGIVEIQTGNFNKLRKKLETFLEVTTVTVVYPIPSTKWIVWIDDSTGEVTDKRKSTKKGSPYEAFFELYKIKSFLTHHNFRLCIVMIDIIEYRKLDGWSEDRKKGSSRYERIPVEIIDEIYIDNKWDFEKLIPQDMPKNFTSKDFKKLSALNLKKAQTAMNILQYVGVIKQIGKDGRLHLYEKQAEYVTF